MANRRRGEVEAVIDGEPVVLCLTLGALAELEAAFGAADLVALGERFATGRFAARDLEVILACGLSGGGRRTTPAEAATLRLDGGLAGLIAVVADLFEATFGPARGEGGAEGRGEGASTSSTSAADAVRPPLVPGAASPSPGTR